LRAFLLGFLSSGHNENKETKKSREKKYIFKKNAQSPNKTYSPQQARKHNQKKTNMDGHRTRQEREAMKRQPPMERIKKPQRSNKNNKNR